MRKRKGIVLRTFFPKKKKIAVLQADGSHLHYVPQTENIGVGTLIHYYANGHWMQSMEKIALPFERAREDILFLHHLLELCYHFIPVGDTPVPLAFDYLRYVYEFPRPFTSQEKKLLLAKLYILFGMMPHESLCDQNFIARIMYLPVDRVVDEHLDLAMESSIDGWLRHCIALHPSSSSFKTAHFLEINRNS